MGFRWRIRVLPGVRINVSGRGVSTSLGGGPISVNVSKHGVVSTAFIPGAGLSYVHRDGGAKERLDNSPLQLRPMVDSEPADTSRISRRTLKTLDRYFAVTPKDVAIGEEGLQFAFDIHCRECGGPQLSLPAGTNDNDFAYCRACGIKFGMVAEIRAYAEQHARDHWDAMQVELAQEHSPQKPRRRWVGAVLLAGAAAAGVWLVSPKSPTTPAPRAEPESSAEAPMVQPLAALSRPFVSAGAATPPPETMLAPLPPRRPPEFSASPRVPSR